MIRKLKNFAHLLLAVIANVIYGFPGRKITVIGVTGTDGKTTTTSMIYHLLKTAGKKAAMITTVGAYINDQVKETGFHVTTPSAFTIQKFLKEAVDLGHEFVVVETSSHGIDQNRVWGIRYKIAAITNITHEHLDYHPSFQEYVDTKFKLLKSASVAVINADDQAINSKKKELTNKIITYSREQDADYNLLKYPFELNVFGSFNQSNALAAIAVCKELGISDESIRAGLKTFATPTGRQDIVYDNQFKVMVDFAHTPNAIETVLSEAKKSNPKRLIHLFGAPGRRDESKRPLMGAASAKYADVIVVTADDPRDEKISKIIEQVKQGIPGKFRLNENLFEIEDRRKALEFALNMAQEGDFVVLTGKGHEPTLALATGELPWNEKEIALEIISKK